jgi:hypothetical protein
LHHSQEYRGQAVIEHRAIIVGSPSIISVPRTPAIGETLSKKGQLHLRRLLIERHSMNERPSPPQTPSSRSLSSFCQCQQGPLRPFNAIWDLWNSRDCFTQRILRIPILSKASSVARRENVRYTYRRQPSIQTTQLPPYGGAEGAMFQPELALHIFHWSTFPLMLSSQDSLLITIKKAHSATRPNISSRSYLPLAVIEYNILRAESADANSLTSYEHQENPVRN